MEPDAAMRQKSKGRPGKSAQPPSRFKAQGLAPKLHQNDLPKAKPSDVYSPPEGSMPITSEPAPSLRPWPSATGAPPLRTMFNLTCPPKCWVKIGHFYFAGNRTFLLCLVMPTRSLDKPP